ncbi:MAG TPA: hypothetical protein VFV13_07995 [Acidimicrobiia bacterium]|nr:hypothetical protein [Acidimicrobiia bacterium]
MIRRLAAGLIVVGLAVGIWALWPRDDTDPSPTTTPTAADPTSSITTVPQPTSTVSVVTTSTVGTHVVATVAEAEEILRSLWFGWFEGIYNQDEARIREVVGTQAMLEAARSQFGVMEFTAPPQSEAITSSEVEILRSDAECLATWASVSASFRPGSTQGVQILRYDQGRWVFVGSWTHREDLWEADCESPLDF